MNEKNLHLQLDELKGNIPKEECLNYQLGLLKNEIQYINDIYSHVDQISQTIKNWSVLVWAGSIAIALGQNDLRKYIILTIVIPVIFWFMDAHWKRLQRRTGFRAQKIYEFLNDGRLIRSFETGSLVDFQIYDPSGRQYRKTKEYKKYIKFWRAFTVNEVKLFYLGLFIISLAIGLFFLIMV